MITEIKNAREFRQAADRLLSQLQADRAWIRQRLIEAGRFDPLEHVRGQSALDHAIVTTCDMIRRAEALEESRAAGRGQIETIGVAQPVAVIA